MSDKPLKRCSKCGEWKEVGEFYGEKNSRDGYRADCKKCFKVKVGRKARNIKERIGERYGRLVVLKCIPPRKTGDHAGWLCKCDCGKEKIVYGLPRTSSCGCLMLETMRRNGKKYAEKIKRDLTGKQFGRWTVLREIRRLERLSGWLCRCDCGSSRVVSAESLVKGYSVSCGCYQKEIASKVCVTTGKANRIRGESQTEAEFYKEKRDRLHHSYVIAQLKSAYGIEAPTYAQVIKHRERLMAVRKIRELNKEVKNVSVDGNV